jgi:hypothetical protein
VTLRDLAERIGSEWSRETSADPERWSPENPAWGQCAITALVVQDAFGGDLVRGVVDGTSHYWNLCLDGSYVDLTRDQFPRWARIEPETTTRERDYVLSFPETARRYELLRSRL